MTIILLITLFAATIGLGISAIKYSLKVENDNMKYSKLEETNPAIVNIR